MRESTASPLPTPLAPDILVVDLDDTLIKTDLLVEALLSYLKSSLRSPWKLLVGVFSPDDATCREWPLRLRLKLFLAEHHSPDAALLPYRREVLTLIEEAKERGAQVILASASPQPWVESVAKHLGLFDEAYGSRPGLNLKGHAKLETLLTRHRLKGMTYVGDSLADWPLFRRASHGYAVNPSRRLRNRLLAGAPRTQILEARDEEALPRLLVRAMRIHQWSKNILIFVPLATSHRVLDWPLALQSTLAFFSFSTLASAVYIMNDIFDVSADRAHPKKRTRPFASGALSLQVGLFSMALLLALSASLALATGSMAFLALAGGYFLANVAYTLRVKRFISLDVVFLASMYTLRVYAGTLVTGILMSKWLMPFSVFFFFGLGALKRLSGIPAAGAERFVHGHGYDSRDRDALMQLGISSSMVSILVLALYINSREVYILYSHPERLWLLLPPLLYWLSRLWLHASRGSVDADPVLHMFRDKVSYGVGLVAWMIIFMAI